MHDDGGDFGIVHIFDVAPLAIVLPVNVVVIAHAHNVLALDRLGRETMGRRQDPTLVDQRTSALVNVATIWHSKRSQPRIVARKVL